MTSSASDGYESKSTKNRQMRNVPLTRRADELLRGRINGKEPDSYVFTSPKGTRLNGGNLKRSLDWKRTSGGYRIHDLRHTAATNWLRAGIEVTTVSAWPGHTDASITLRVYAHYLGDSADRRAIALLNGDPLPELST